MMMMDMMDTFGAAPLSLSCSELPLQSPFDTEQYFDSGLPFA
jgi:hypothetical protein